MLHGSGWFQARPQPPPSHLGTKALPPTQTCWKDFHTSILFVFSCIACSICGLNTWCKYLQLALRKWERWKRDLGSCRVCCTTVIWNPIASLPEALETCSASLSEATAAAHICWELQYRNSSLQTSCILESCRSCKSSTFSSSLPEGKGKRATLVSMFKTSS